MKTVNTTTVTTDPASEAAFKAVKKAEKALSVANAERTSVYATTLVFDKARVIVDNKVAVATANLALARGEFGRVVEGLSGLSVEDLYDRKVVESISFDLKTDVIDKIIANKGLPEAMSDKARTVFEMLNLCSMTEIVRTLDTIDSRYGVEGNKYSTALKNGIRIAVQKQLANNSFETVYHKVFGGVVGHLDVSPVDSFGIAEIDGLIDLNKIRETLWFVNAEPLDVATATAIKGLVFATTRTFSVTLSKGVSTTMSWIAALKKVRYLSQVVVVSKTTTGVYNIERSLSAIQRLASMNLSGLSLDGLVESPDHLGVVLVPKGATGLGRAEKVTIPFTYGLKQNHITKDTLAVHELLCDKFGPCLHADNYGAHGYISLKKSYLNSLGNAFITKEGYSYENPSKLLARLQKLANNKSEFKFEVDLYLVAGITAEDLLTDHGIKVDVSTQLKFNNQMALTLVAGSLLPSAKVYAKLGTARAVSGALEGESGQKGMLSDPFLCNSVASAAVMEELGNGEYILAGNNSTKSTVFKASDEGYYLQEVEFEGTSAYVWLKLSPKEVIMITDSATAESWEKDADNLEHLTDLPAAVDTFKRRFSAVTSQSVMSLLYGDDFMPGADLFDKIMALREAKVIRRKDIRGKTNSQFNAALEFQHGIQGAKELLEFLVAQNKAGNYRRSLISALKLFTNQVSDTEVGVVDVELLITQMVYLSETYGVLNFESQVYNMYLVNHVIKTIEGLNKPFIQLSFNTTGDSILVPITSKDLSAVEDVERKEEVRVSGILAEILTAMTFYVQRIVEEGRKLEDLLTAESVANTIQKIAKARDRGFGKVLTQIPTIGVNGHLLTAPCMHKNEAYSPALNRAKKLAEKVYKQKVTFIYTKTPILWEGSQTGIKLVDFTTKFGKTDAFVQFQDDRENYHDIMLGQAIIQSAEKAVGGGNDVDGDRATGDAVPKWILDLLNKLNPEVWVDSRDSNIAVAGDFYKNFWEEELKGFYRKAVTLDDFKVTPESYVEDMIQSVVQAVNAKQAVAKYTTQQTTTMNNRGVFVESVKQSIVDITGGFMMDPRFSSLEAWLKGVVASPYAMNKVAEEIWRFCLDVQGAIVNFDAMDLIKSKDGIETKKLAEVISLQSLCHIHVSMLEDKEEDEGKRARLAARLTTSRISEVKELMFSEKGYKLSHKRLSSVFPVNANEAHVQALISLLVVHALRDVAVYTAHHFDRCQEIMRPDSKGERNIETAMLDLQEDKNKTHKSVDCVARVISTAAYKFLGKRLVSLKD